MPTEHADPKRKVLEIIQLRAKSGSRPAQRSDPYHVALVIEGGGMRGVAAGGMVSALERLGLRDAFDSVHGSSAGAVAASYFVAGFIYDCDLALQPAILGREISQDVAECRLSSLNTSFPRPSNCSFSCSLVSRWWLARFDIAGLQ
jgi:predicted acylesterase/phospholipase RssA